MSDKRLLKYLNNQIIIWQNLYGFYYTFLYNEDGSQKQEEINNDCMYEHLEISRTVMEVLQKIKRNRFKDIKKIEKLKYKINKPS